MVIHDIGLEPATRYFYRVRGVAAGASTASGVVAAMTASPGMAPGATVGGGHIYYDKKTRELVNDKTGTRRPVRGMVWLKWKNTRRDFKSAAGKFYRDLPKRPQHS